MLHVWLRAQHSPLVVWHEEGQQWQSVDDWQQLQAIYGNHKTNTTTPVCLYFPSSHVSQVSTDLNGTQLKQLGNSGQQYLFEETSLTPVEQLTVRQISHADRHQLYALAQGDSEAWQQRIQLAGMRVVALLPDFLLLPAPQEGAGQQVTLYQDAHTMLLRQSTLQGMAISYLPLMFERFSHLSEVHVLPPIEGLSGANGASNSAVAQADFMAQTAAVIAEHQLLLTTSSASTVPVESPERHALNFFAKSVDSQLSPYLRVAMMVALSALVLQMVTDGVQWYQYDQAAVATNAEVAAQYQSWFPDEPLSTRTKLQVQLQPKLHSGSQASDSHMAALARISPLIKQSSLHAQALAMQPSTLRFTLITSDRSRLDDFASTLTAQGLKATLGQVSGDGQGQISGQITVDVIESNTATRVAAS